MKPTVPDVLPLVKALYKRNSAGCCLHVLLDDGNVGDSTAAYCLQYARDAGHHDCEELASKVVLMSATQRRKLAHFAR